MLDAMSRLARDVLVEPNFEKAAAMAVARVSMYLDVDVCALYLRDSNQMNLRLIAYEGPNPTQVVNQELPLDRGLPGLVATRAEPIRTDNAPEHPAFELVPNIDHAPFQSFMGAPIVYDRESIGVLVVRREYDGFNDEEEGVLLSVATKLSPRIAKGIALGESSSRSTHKGRSKEKKFRGVPGSVGCTIGTGYLIQPEARLHEVPVRNVEGIAAEIEKFENALHKLRQHHLKLYESLQDLEPIDREIFNAHLHILDDPAMIEEIAEAIKAEQQWAPSAIKQVFLKHIDKIQDVNDEYLSERADMLRDLGQQLLAKLQDIQTKGRHAPPNNTILVAEEVSASMIAEIPSTKLKGVISKSGSANAHTAILARALGIPAVMGAWDVPLYESDDVPIALDGTFGNVVLNPSKKTKRVFRDVIEQGKTFAKELAELRELPATTKDGHRVPLWANIGLAHEVELSLNYGAEGIGLFRTEIPFASSSHFPTESQQKEIYRHHMKAFGSRPVTMRMLDIGGDKQLPYFTIDEDNPYLGWRGVRVILDHPEIFLVQARAMLKANAGLPCHLRIMLPMVTNLEEINFARNLIDRAVQEVEDEGVSVRRPEIGALIEVPALIFQSRLFARAVDFIAVGTNDLTQYMLAVSRTNPRVAKLYQEFHPSVLRALRILVKDTHAEGKPIGICGEVAGTVEGAILLIGMGFDVLSMNATNIPVVKWTLRRLTRVGCRRILSKVLQMEDANSILKYVHSEMSTAGLNKVLPTHESYLN